MKTFERRIYHSLGELLSDFRNIMSWREGIRSWMRGMIIATAFREGLMLVDTAVNRCRYCLYVHTRETLSNGIPQDEIEVLAQGVFEGSSSEEVPALL